MTQKCIAEPHVVHCDYRVSDVWPGHCDDPGQLQVGVLFL